MFEFDIFFIATTGIGIRMEDGGDWVIRRLFEEKKMFRTIGHMALPARSYLNEKKKRFCLICFYFSFQLFSTDIFGDVSVLIFAFVMNRMCVCVYMQSSESTVSKK